ncbi:hypothetical protein [Carboxylicivirga sp. RSCT41]|uniref:hypothetical protein n=1 Tax=Carboxylicivirga agarovorans TaxID=3417570 RepID=UPI003D330E7B
MRINNIFQTITALLAVMVLLTSCGEVEKQLFDDKDAFFAFEGSALATAENGTNNLYIPVYIARSIAEGNVSFEVITEGYENPAIEGDDFKILTGNSTISFNGEFYESIEIELINNEDIDGDKKFKLVLASNNIGATHGLANGENSEFEITIIDDEHPLAPILGSYLLYWDSPWNGSGLTEENQIFSVPGSTTEVDIVIGFYRDHGDFAQCTKVRAEVDMEALTLSIQSEQETYNDGTHILTIYGDDEEPGGVVVDTKIVADIDLSAGEIVFRTPFAIAFTGGPNEGYYEDLYINPILRKQ